MSANIELLQTSVGRNEIIDLAHRIAIEAEAHQAYRGSDYVNQKDIFQGLGISELYFLVEQLSVCETVDQAYTLMALPTDDRSSNYYDRLIAPQHRLAYRGLATVLARTESHRVPVAMDVGAGTGESTLVAAKHAGKVIAVDTNQAMLNIAVKKLQADSRPGATKNIQAIVGDVLSVNIEPDSVDFVTDNGLLGYLSASQVDAYWRLIRTWLKPGGRYYTFDSAQESSEIYGSTLRARLAGLAVNSVFRLSHIYEQRRSPPPTHLAEQYGFKFHLHKIQLEPFKAGVVQWTKIR